MRNKTVLLLQLMSWVVIATFINNINAQSMKNDLVYEAKWKEIDSLLNQENLPKSALEKINAVWNTANQENNEPQQVKALIYWSNASSKISENVKDTLLPIWMDNIEKANGVHMAVLQSILAEMVWNYLENNRWEIKGRTTTEDFTKTDMATWAENDFENKTSELYLASVSDIKAISIPIKEYGALINKGKNTNFLRPLVADVLLARAIEHFTNTRSQINKPVNPFRLNDDALFGPAESFMQMQLLKNDTLSPDYKILVMLQEWLRSHSLDAQQDAFINIDLQRLDFLKSNAAVKQKEKLYRDALNLLVTKYKKCNLLAEMYYRLASSYNESGNEWDGKSEMKKWDFKTAYSLATSGTKVNAGTQGNQNCLSVIKQLEQPTLNISLEATNLPNKTNLGFVSYKNLDNFYFRLIQKTDLVVKKLKSLQEEGAEQQKLIAYLKTLPFLQESSSKLTNPSDYREHSAEFMFDKLKSGSYIMLVSNVAGFEMSEKDVASFLNFNVSNLSLAVSETGNISDLLLQNRETGAPIKGGKVKITKVTNTYKDRVWSLVSSVFGKTLITDSQGFVHVDLSKSNRDYNTYYLIEASYGDDKVEISTQGNYQSNPTNLQSYSQTYFYTDRSIYRPGQTIYFKGLLLSKLGLASKIVPNQKVRITFFNTNSQKIEEKVFQTNEYGSFDGSFTAPMSGLRGQMRLNSDQGGMQWVSIEEYKRPTFEVLFDKIEGEFKLNDIVTVKAKAMAFAGNVLTGAKVTYRVVRKTSYPFWYFYRYMPYNIASQEIIQGESLTDDQGYFTLRFPLVPDDNDDISRKPVYNYEVNVDMTDQAGETRVGSTNVSAGYVSVNLVLDVKSSYNKAEDFNVKLNINNLNGLAIKAPVNVKIFKLKEPDFLIKSKYWHQAEYSLIESKTYRANFPNYAMGNEGEKENWAIETNVFQQNYDSSSVIKSDISNWKPGVYRMLAEVKDNSGNPVILESYFDVTSKDRKAIISTQSLDFTLDKDEYQPGDVSKCMLTISKDVKHVWVEISRQNNLLKSYWLDVKSETKIEIPITEVDRGNLAIRIYYLFDNRKYEDYKIVKVPWKNKDLKIEYLSFRDKLLPGQNEEWKIKISGANKEKVMAELSAAMYDASLDVFKYHSWSGYFFESANYSRSRFNFNSFNPVSAQSVGEIGYESTIDIMYPFIDYFGYYPSLSDQRYYRRMEMKSMMAGGAPTNMRNADMPMNYESASADKLDGVAKAKQEEPSPAPKITPPTAEPKPEKPEFSVRQNLKETVFFMPKVQTDAEGNYILNFKMNEALTKWKLLLFAHTKELAYMFDSKTVITQKELMIQPNMPRFLRQGDTIMLSARISNLSKKELAGNATVQILDALNGQDITKVFVENNGYNFKMNAGQTSMSEWKMVVPDTWTGPIDYKVIASAGEYADGEGGTLPVVTDRVLVTESLPLPVKAGQTRSFELKSMSENNSNTLQNVQYMIEFTPNPVWFAVKSLPYLTEYPYECSEQIFSRIYANVLAAYVANKNPDIKKFYQKWEKDGGLQSKLSSNESLKTALLEETPWVLDAKNEEDQMAKMKLLFDMQRIENETSTALDKLKERQQSDGGFGWFNGERSSWYITQYIMEGFAHLDRLKVVQESDKYNTLISRGLEFIDIQFLENYKELEKLVNKGKAKWEDDHLSDIVLHYMYTRSFDTKMNWSGDMLKAKNYYLGQIEKYWTKRAYYQQGLMALVLHRMGNPANAQKIVKSLKENSINNSELGMFWKANWGYYWYQMPIETQSLMIEVFDEVAKDRNAVDDLRIWLLKNKQTNSWKTTKATSEAIYALLLTGSDWVSETKMPEIKIGNEKLDISKLAVEPGTGYFKKTYSKLEISKEMSHVEVYNPNKNISWGGIYWQYLEKMDKVKDFKETPLTLTKEYFILKNTDSGPVMKPVSTMKEVQLGDKVRVRIELRVDRMMEYVHLKDMRGSGFEPVNVLSAYKYQGGLGYYESTRDLATDFFISYLPTGTYVFEYDLRANNKGSFSMGISTIQCMYAPEFSSHSEGRVIGIK